MYLFKCITQNYYYRQGKHYSLFVEPTCKTSHELNVIHDYGQLDNLNFH